MSYKNNNRILNHVAESMYLEDMEPILEAERIQKEIDECYARYDFEREKQIESETYESWEDYAYQQMQEAEDSRWDEFYELRFWDEILDEELQMEETIEEADYSLWLLEVLLREEIKEEVTAKEEKNVRAQRRKQKVHYKQKVRRNALAAMQNMQKRCNEDMNNITLCKNRHGNWVQMPKSLSARAEEIWARARKMHLVEENDS